MPTKPRSTRTTTKRAGAGRELMWQEAAAFASRAHRHQIRKDGRTPYVSHVFRVCMTLTQVFGCNDPAAVAAALLHDTIEDTTTDFDDLEERFGREVATLVAALTKNMALPEDPREDEYDARLARADWRARLIKLADVYDNYCDTASWPTAKQRRIKIGENRVKCERALALAKVDAHRPEVRRAMEAVRGLIGR